MRKVDLGSELSDSIAKPDGPQKAATSALLLLLNAVHLIEPNRDQYQPLRSLRDGQLPNGLLLGALQGLSAHKKTLRSVGSGGKIKTGTQKPKDPPRARTALNALTMLLQTERCALAERKPSGRDDLVMQYLGKTKGLTSYANLSKTRSTWRRKYTNTGLFGEPEQMRAFVCAVLLSMLGDAAKLLTASSRDKDTIEAFRACGARVHARLLERIPDPLVMAALGSMFDFSFHSDEQVSATLESVSDGSAAPLFKQDTGELGWITADVLPVGILSGRSLPN